MFKRKDLPPLFLLLVLLCFIMVALSQILVVRQRSRYMKPMQKLMRSKQWYTEIISGNKMTNDPNSMFGFNSESERLLNEIYVSRIASLIQQTSNASKTLANNARSLTTSKNELHKEFPANAHLIPILNNNNNNNKNNNNQDNGKNDVKNDRLTYAVESQKSSQNFGNYNSNKNTGRNNNNNNNSDVNVSLGLRTMTRVDTNINKEKNPNIITLKHNSSLSNNNNNNDDDDFTKNSSKLDRIDDQWNISKQKRFTERPGNTVQGNNRTAQYCPEIPPDLQGKIDVNFNDTENIKVKNIKMMNLDLKLGGAWKPAHCISRHRVAIIIPYRDRHQHLLTLLYHLLPMLQRQQLDFRVFVVEQLGNDSFNKGRIMNAAFKEALKLYTFHCCIFHDVDLIPEDDRNMYSCPEFPRHLSVAVDEMEYKLAYTLLVGGVLNMRVEHFQIVNGYSNLYWGWGAEDDDMAYRILYRKLKIIRPPIAVARYKMIPHRKRKPSSWVKRSRLLRTGRKRLKFDGLNSLKYKLIFSHEDSLFTHFMVDIGPPPKLL